MSIKYFILVNNFALKVNLRETMSHTRTTSTSIFMHRKNDSAACIMFLTLNA